MSKVVVHFKHEVKMIVHNTDFNSEDVKKLVFNHTVKY